jgi:hypothetical protein
MDTAAALARLDAALSEQLTLASADSAVETAARALRGGLAPALRQLALDLAEQAASEVGAQLAEHDVDVVLHQGEPALVLRPREQPARDTDADTNASRLTLRLPASLKEDVEAASRADGVSVNGWIVDAIARALRRATRRRPGMRVRGSIRT